MFSKKPVNRKRHRKTGTRRRPPIDTIESLRDTEFQLNAQIGELEKVLAKHRCDETRPDHPRREHILPPPDYGTHKTRNSPKTLSYGERRRRNQQRNRSGLYFLMLLAIAGALAFWLFSTGG